ncbi:hypothetical protein DL546_005262 [Coniochaeta pulveracea]|uniref:Uncharacterized protein n=1 Tax=Coniochaeta pulveracea TaxID=177199 RepID=A0A420Y9W7_9PEZI|nr:hypothetical protein DL546_005262 [Coniochaeta pulveracea]
MAGDSKTGRRRGNSVTTNTKNIAIHTRQQSRQTNQSNSQHLADPFLHDFLSTNFDPADYLNSVLPPLHASSNTSSANHGAVPLAELSSQAQTTLLQLNAHTTRLTNTLTQLTDDILRSGSRLAYEVELLRGETLGLAESLTEGLHDDIDKFVPGGLQVATSLSKPTAPAVDGQETGRQRGLSVSAAAPLPSSDEQNPPVAETAATPDEPSYITQLRTLTLVRSRLDSVIKTFGDAMEFVFPPSELSVGSSFLSVSAPDPGPESHSTEEKGRQVLQKLRDEISSLLDNKTDPIQGIEDAARRIEELKELTEVWKGTAEEKGRNKFIETLARMVEVRHQELLKEMDRTAKEDGKRVETGAQSKQEGDSQAESRGYGGYALLGQLQKLRSGL